MTEVEEFIEVFRPHTGRYVEKDPIAGYRLKRAELTPKIVEAHIKGQRVISFFTRVTRNIIGLDVDDHKGGGWVGGEPTARLLHRYREVVFRIRRKPSGVFRSDHGVHVYWILATCVPDRILIDGLREKFGELLTDEEMRIAEILPTNAAALKIPRPERYLDEALNEARFPGYRAMAVYAVGEIFGEALTPDNLRYQRTSRMKVARSANAAKAGKATNPAAPEMEKSKADEVGAWEAIEAEANAECDTCAQAEVGAEAKATPVEGSETKPMLTVGDIEKAEHECGPFKNGQGNGQYLRLIKVYRRAGISQGDAVDRLKGILARSSAYVGDIRTGLEGRVEASYRRLTGPAEGIGLESAALRRDRHAMAFVTMVIDDLGMKNPQERAAAERFLLRLWAWKVYLDGKMKRPDEAWAWEYENPRFRKMMAEGWYPLPSSLLRKWRHDYNRITKSLSALGVIVESPYHYSTDLRRCKHYALNLRRMQRTGGKLVIAGTLTITKTK